MALYRQFIIEMGGNVFVDPQDEDFQFEDDEAFVDCTEPGEEENKQVKAVSSEDEGFDDNQMDTDVLEIEWVKDLFEGIGNHTSEDWNLRWRMEQELQKFRSSFVVMMPEMFTLWVVSENRAAVIRQTKRLVRRLRSDTLDKIERIKFEIQRRWQN